MGTSFSDLLKDTRDESLEQFEVLQEMADSIVKAESSRMEARAYEDKTLPIVAIVDVAKHSSIGVEAVSGENVNQALANLFKGNLLAGLEETISATLKQFLGNVHVGKQETSQFHVVFDNNSLLRVDIYFYKYEFKTEGFRKYGRNMFCFVAQVGVLDCMKIDPQVTLYNLTKSIGHDKVAEAQQQLEAEASFAEALYKEIKRLKIASFNDESV